MPGTIKRGKGVVRVQTVRWFFLSCRLCIELAFKARICKILGTDYPESGEISRSYKTHKLDNLLKLSGLYTSFDHDINQNAALKVSWSVVKSWSEAYRYSPKGTNSQQDVRDLIEAIEHPDHGILTWLKKKW